MHACLLPFRLHSSNASLLAQVFVASAISRGTVFRLFVWLARMADAGSASDVGDDLMDNVSIAETGSMASHGTRMQDLEVVLGKKVRVCKMCNSRSDEPNPLPLCCRYTRFRPWLAYRRCGTNQRAAYGAKCAICWNVWRQAGSMKGGDERKNKPSKRRAEAQK